VTLEIEVVVDGGVDGEEPLCGSMRFELLLSAFPSSNDSPGEIDARRRGQRNAI
jgi:hypothetical protein